MVAWVNNYINDWSPVQTEISGRICQFQYDSIWASKVERWNLIHSANGISWPGMWLKLVVNSGINYQPQRVSSRISEPSTVDGSQRGSWCQRSSTEVFTSTNSDDLESFFGNKKTHHWFTTLVDIFCVNGPPWPCCSGHMASGVPVWRQACNRGVEQLEVDGFNGNDMRKG